MFPYRLAKQTSRVEWSTISRRNYPNLTLRHHRGLGYRNTEQVWVNGPQSWGQCAKLNSLDAAALDERDWVLEIVVSVLRSVRCKDPARWVWFTVDSFDDSHLIGSDLNQRDLAHNFFKRKLDQVKPRFENIRLNAYLAFSGHDSSWRHLCAEVATFLDGDFACADVYKDTPYND